MADYPVEIPMPSDPLPGNPPDTVVRGWCDRIKDYMNKQAKTQAVAILAYSQIARGTGIDEETVEALVRPLPDGGGTGITIYNRQLENNRQI